VVSIPFAPTIIEHAAALIGCLPSEAAQSVELMAKAHIEAYKRYNHPIVTVGIDVYNIEAQALGCDVRFYNNASIPGVVTHPYTLDSDPGLIRFSPDAGRIQLVLNAAIEVKRVIGAETTVSIGICGPYSIMIELLGFDAAVDALFEEDERVFPYLDALLTHQMEYCSLITSEGLGVTLFDSWASPPVTSPHIYRTYAAPYERGLISHLDSFGLASRPLVIGGDTSLIVDDILSTGTTLLVSDYNAPLTLYAEKAKNHDVTLRANIDPKKVWSGDWDHIRSRINDIRSMVTIHPKTIIGTGVMPYDTNPGHVLHVKEIIKTIS